jgi:methylenetetrahydrofolate reductase (NADPH)
MAQYMATQVAGITIPEGILRRLGSAPKEKAAEEGIKICLETIQELREMKGLRGVHIMAIGWEEKVPELVKSSGLYPRPQPA